MKGDAPLTDWIDVRAVYAPAIRNRLVGTSESTTEKWLMTYIINPSCAVYETVIKRIITTEVQHTMGRRTPDIVSWIRIQDRFEHALSLADVKRDPLLGESWRSTTKHLEGDELSFRLINGNFAECTYTHGQFASSPQAEVLIMAVKERLMQPSAH